MCVFLKVYVDMIMVPAKWREFYFFLSCLDALAFFFMPCCVG